MASAMHSTDTVQVGMSAESKGKLGYKKHLYDIEAAVLP